MYCTSRSARVSAPMNFILNCTEVSYRELPDLKKKPKQMKLLRAFDNCVDKELLDNFLPIQVVTKTRKDMIKS